jgi:hypothetical protein
MNCEEFWNGEPHGLEHLRACAACSTRFERHQELAVELHRLGAQMRHLQAPDRVERRVAAGFRARAEIGRQAAPPSVWWTFGAWAAGILVTVGIAFFLAGGRQPERTERLRRHATQLAAIEAPAEFDAIEESGFIALPNAELIAPNEEINLVRVQLPRSAMISLGFAVSEDSLEEQVEADVMLGADGVARAVRFLD